MRKEDWGLRNQQRRAGKSREGGGLKAPADGSLGGAPWRSTTKRFALCSLPPAALGLIPFV